MFQQKIFGIIANLAYDFEASYAVDLGPDDLIQQGRDLLIASAPEDEKLFPVRRLSQCRRLLIKPVSWVPVLERAAAVVPP